ncbi:MAG TPA: ABC transporter substrate-binding protein [Chloroflexota bacterium]|nr:ABC transporter substrate-binding protein [Chloroflexota bacterium]
MLTRKRFLSRRRFLLTSGGMGAAAIVAACSPSTPASPTTAPSTGSSSSTPSSGAAATATTAPATSGGAQPTAAAQPTVAPAQSGNQALKQVPRNKTLILGCADGPNNQFADVTLMNPYLHGITRSGYNITMEPLYYYNAYNTDAVCGPEGMTCKGGEIPWLAESYSYNQDFTQLSIKIRQGAAWNDGQPFTANDVAFTINMLKDNAPTMTWSTDMKQWVKEATAIDANTAQITLTAPNPRFFFSYFTFHQDVGVQIQPEHIWKGQNPTKFTNFDMSKGWPVTTGPWKLALSSPDQKIWDRDPNWWAAKTNFHPLPQPERIIYLPNFDEPKLVQLLVSNQADQTLDLRPNNVKAALQQNPKLSVWTDKNALPYGYLDWWPVSLGFNDSKAPWNDPEIRWAVNHAIDRKQLVEVGYGGAGVPTLLPFPDFPALQTYTKGLSDLLQQNPIDAFDVNKTATIMQSKGYAKDQGGFWAKDGKRLSMVILIFQIFQDITPVLVAQLRKAGFDANFKAPANAGDIEAQGDEDAFISGHGGSIRDPYFTMRLYQSRFSAPTGQAAVYPYRWKNDDFDKIVDTMGETAPDDPKLEQLFHQAMQIWIPALPDIGLVQWFHRIPVNTTYWTNWPNEKNPYINSANWHRTAPLWINTLKPVSG